MINIDKMLNKKKWTGSEVGRLQIAFTLQSFEKAKTGKVSSEFNVSRADIRKMLDSLRDPADIEIYNGYVHIHEWFRITCNAAAATEQAAHLNFTKLSEILTVAHVAEDIYDYISKLPVIMTQKQYEDLAAIRKQEILHPNGKNTGFNLFKLLELAVIYEANRTETAPGKKTLLKPLKKKLESEPVTDQHILSRYNEVMKVGYYTLKDGRRVDQMSREELKKILFKDRGELTEYELNALDEIRESVQDSIYSGMPEEDAYFEIFIRYIEKGLFKEYEFHYYEELPKGITKWEVLKNGDLSNWYYSLKGGSYDGKSYEESLIEDITAFKKEFSDVVGIILKDMERYIQGVSSIPAEKWIDTVYEWEELYNLDFYGFRKLYVENDINVFNGNSRALHNGIAIFRPNDLLDIRSCIDQNTGYYKPPKIEGMADTIGLDAYFKDSKDYAKNVKALGITRKQLLNSYYYMKGWNTAIDLIAEEFDIDEIKIGKLRLEQLEDMIDYHNMLVKNLYSRIKTMDYPDKELQKKKLEVLKNVLNPISIDKIEIPKERIEQAKADMINFEAFKNESKDLRITLCFPTEKL